jgi:hypothetical protein
MPLILWCHCSYNITDDYLVKLTQPNLVKRFIVILTNSARAGEQACGLYYKGLTIVIYDHNDSTIVDPVLLNYDYNCNLWY